LRSLLHLQSLLSLSTRPRDHASTPLRLHALHNVRWEVFNFVDFSQAANRKRLVIYAAQRNYPLPSSPSPTHSEHNHRYIYDAISNIPPNATWHLDKAYWFPHPKTPIRRSHIIGNVYLHGRWRQIFNPSGQRNFIT